MSFRNTGSRSASAPRTVYACTPCVQRRPPMRSRMRLILPTCPPRAFTIGARRDLRIVQRSESDIKGDPLPESDRHRPSVLQHFSMDTGRCLAPATNAHCPRFIAYSRKALTLIAKVLKSHPHHSSRDARHLLGNAGIARRNENGHSQLTTDRA
jgi:hypothetical protein